MYNYIIYIIILLIFIIYIRIRLKFGFWYSQPVFHIYNIGYILKPPGIIESSLPKKNKYTNFREIDTIIQTELNSIQINNFVKLINENYLQNKDNVFSPKKENIMPYFVGHNDKSFISFYFKDQYLLDLNKGDTILNRKIIGSITSRPMSIFINNNDENALFNAYYVDYLCVDKRNRKKGIAPQLIQTHNYNQRILNKNIVVSIFKREDELTGIVPICVYSTYGFYVDKWTKPVELSLEYKVLEINQTNIRFLYDFINTNKRKFDIVMKVELANLIELIKTKNIFVNVILCDENILCCYFFRKSCVQIEKGLEVLSCFASICDCEENIFVQGFKISFWKIAADNFFGFSAIENVSHNNILINNIMLKTKPSIISPTAYYFYNFAYPTFKPNKALIIN